MTEFKFQASVKDADGDMVNVRADSESELEHNLLAFPVGAYAQFKANVRGGSALGALAQPSQAPPQQAQPNGWGQAQPAQQPQQQAAPPQQNPSPGGWQAPATGHPEGWTCPACNSVLQYKVVTRKSDQKQFKFWACPNQRSKDDGHRTEFAN